MAVDASLYIPPPGDWRSPGPGVWGGGMGGEGYVCEQRSIFRSCSYLTFGLRSYLYQLGFGISQQCCILPGLPVQSTPDAFAGAVSAARFRQFYNSTKLLNEYGPWSAVKRRVSENASCSRVMLRMAAATAEILWSMASLNCASDAYRLAFWRESSLVISFRVSLSLENARSRVTFA
jgi:hypothetical protein